MTVTQIIQFPAHDAAATLQAINKAAPEDVIQGTLIQDKSTAQAIVEWQGTSDEIAPDVPSSSSFRIDLARPALGPKGPATAPVVEYVHTFFPVSKVTPEFKKKIEDDFVRFNELFLMIGLVGEMGCTMGWSVDEVNYAGIEGEKAVGFVVIRGWDTMANFEKVMSLDKTREVLSILFGWGAPYKMWHVAREDGARGSL
ncbi:hypothetical protein EJ05DRAFT_486254 [Pseudovirgaria hyperparasitica]|uniref:ABM domain-containing protein n=1 Tax=Pseudovirgaria hyperparasitica TaxID=470096 RepID=A0A6A6W854_9PEZI|nr:uncharacterized protein EJ05DRAFT_486254 [Pseudovirgaria hyperparasitica]KAF2758204.1 hypothetical protein EJ05DRAFT_486254 [Pseudovirgaria hyperparasitica]